MNRDRDEIFEEAARIMDEAFDRAERLHQRSQRLTSSTIKIEDPDQTSIGFFARSLSKRFKAAKHFFKAGFSIIFTGRATIHYSKKV
jgi:hypothetical protein